MGGGLSKYRVEFQVSTQYTGEDQRLLRENPNWAKTLGGERIHYIFHAGTCIENCVMSACMLEQVQR